MDGFRARTQRKVSLQQEKRVAAAMGGRTQAASGATKFGGGDVRAPGCLIECKYTDKASYKLKEKELYKLRTQAAKRLEEPVFVFGFRNRFGRISEQYAVLRYHPKSVFSATDYTHAGSITYKREELMHRTMVEIEGGKMAYAVCFRIDVCNRNGLYGNTPLEEFFIILPWEEFCQTREIRSDQGAT